MDIKMADGNSVTLDDLVKDVEAAKGKYRTTAFCFTYVTVEALLEKLKELDPEKQFTVYWFGGDRQVIKGSDFATACNNAGIGAGAFGAMDFYDYGDSKSHLWSPTLKNWVPASEFKEPAKGNGSKPRTRRQIEESKNVR